MVVTIRKESYAQKSTDSSPKDITIELEEQYINKSGGYKSKNQSFFIDDEDLGRGIGRYEITYYGSPKIIIDKLAFTYPAPKEQYQNIKSICQGMYAFSDLDKYYRYNYMTNINGHALKISFEPHDKSYNYLRIEYNPANHKSNKKILKVMRQLLPDGIDKKKIKISRIDIAQDYPCIKPKHLMMNAVGFSSSTVFTDSDGNIETIYLGSPSSKIQHKIYDKTEEQQNKGNSMPQHTRIEVSIRKVSYQDLMLLNPFEKLQLFYAPRSNSPFIQKAKSEGLQEALRQLTKKKREQQEAMLIKLICAWWSPSNVLPKYLIKISNIGLFNSLKYIPI